MASTWFFSGFRVRPSTTGQEDASSGAPSLSIWTKEDRPHAGPVLLLHGRPCGRSWRNQWPPVSAAPGWVGFYFEGFDRVVCLTVKFYVQLPVSSGLVLLLHHRLLLLQPLNLWEQQIREFMKKTQKSDEMQLLEEGRTSISKVR